MQLENEVVKEMREELKKKDEEILKLKNKIKEYEDNNGLIAQHNKITQELKQAREYIEILKNKTKLVESNISII